MFLRDSYLQKTKDIFLTPEDNLQKPYIFEISIKLCINLCITKMLFLKIKTNPSYNETSRQNILKLPPGISYEHEKYKQKTICKNFIEPDSNIHKSIRKCWALGTKKEVS